MINESFNNSEEEMDYMGDWVNDLDDLYDYNDLKTNKTPKVFLGGTCNDSKWRDYVISKLNIDYFNPVVEDWTDECYERELIERKTCDYCLYVITPRMQGVYSIAEVIDDSNKKPMKTIFCVLEKDGYQEFTKWQLRSLSKVSQMVINNGGHYFNNLDDVIDFLNNRR